MREGSVLIWNQIMFHGTSPNYSKVCRMAQFLKAFPRACISEGRMKARANAFLRFYSIENHGDSRDDKKEDNREFDVSDFNADGMDVFGLDTVMM